jgi:hypothetical protein
VSISVILHFIGSESILEIKKKLVILEDEAEVVCRVFELTNQRYFKMEICRLFNEEGGIDSRAVYEQTTEIRQQESCLKRIAVDE